MQMFTKEEALKILSEQLQVKDFEQRFQNDRKNLLDEIATSIQTHLVFQNLRLLQNVPEKRRRPSLEEIKADFISGIGGLCFNLNVAAYFLLKALGFRSSISLATCTSSVLSLDNHVVVYVADVEKAGDKYIIEVGFAFPTFRAISLDFEDESPPFIDSFIEYKYIKHGGKLLRMHRKGDLVKHQDTNSADGLHFFINGWRRYYFTNPEGSNTVEELYPHFDKVFTDPKASPFHLTFRSISFPGKKAVMVINEKTLIENDEGELIPTVIEGGDAGIVQTVRHHFPVLPEDLVRQALASWRQTQ